MTESMAKKIGFGLLVLGLLTGWVGTAVAQQNLPSKQEGESQADYNRRVAAASNPTGKVVTATQYQAERGIGKQQTKNTINQFTDRTVDKFKNDAQNETVATINAVHKNFNAEVMGISLTRNLGQRITASAIKSTGDDSVAQNVAAAQGISQENLNKVSAGTGGGVLGTGFMSRNAIDYKAADGTTIHMDANLNSTEGMMEGCMPIPVKLDQLKNCIFCPLFLILYNTAEAMATASFGVLADGFKVLLMIGFGLYIAYLTLRQVSAFTKQDAPKYITESLTMAFKVLLAWLILSNGAELYRLGLEPLLSAGIEFGQTFLTHQNTGGTNVSIESCKATGGMVSGTTTYFYSHGLYQKIDCFLRKVTQEIAVSQSIGSSLMCVARHKASGLIMWDLTMFATGLLIWIFAWLICLAFAFYLIDTVIRLGIIGAITPFLIAAWPFKITQGYTGTGWKMFLNAFFTFVFLGLVISVNVELSAQSMTGGTMVITKDANNQEISSVGADAIIALVNSNDIEALNEVMGIGLSGLIFLILCCIFGFKLCAEAAALAGEFSGAKSTDIGSKIGSVAAGAAKGIGLGTAKAVGKGAMIMGEATGINDGIREGFDKVHQGFDKAVKSVGLSRFSATAAGRLKNQGTAQNIGATQPGGSDDEAQNKNPMDDQNAQQQAVQQPNKPAEEAMLDKMIARGDMSSEQEDAALNAAIAAQSQRQKPAEEAMLDEMIKSGNFDEAQLDKALDDGIAQERARTIGKESGERETAQAKADIAAAAASEAEKASRVVNGGTGAHNRYDDTEDKRGQKKDSGATSDMRDELDASRMTINQLRAELDELKKKLRDQGGMASSTGGSSHLDERIKKLEEELKRRGGSI